MQVAEVLLGAAADVNARGSEQNTPLHYVALSDAVAPLALAELLLARGAMAAAKNRFGKTACDLALFQGAP